MFFLKKSASYKILRCAQNDINQTYSVQSLSIMCINHSDDPLIKNSAGMSRGVLNNILNVNFPINQRTVPLVEDQFALMNLSWIALIA